MWVDVYLFIYLFHPSLAEAGCEAALCASSAPIPTITQQPPASKSQLKRVVTSRLTTQFNLILILKANWLKVVMRACFLGIKSVLKQI